MLKFPVRFFVKISGYHAEDHRAILKSMALHTNRLSNVFFYNIAHVAAEFAKGYPRGTVLEGRLDAYTKAEEIDIAAWTPDRIAGAVPAPIWAVGFQKTENTKMPEMGEVEIYLT